MTTLRVTCVECGDIELAVEDVRVRVCVDTDDADYRFTCFSCNMVSVKPMEPRTLDLLSSAGVPVSSWELPADLSETHEGSIINHDDILDFHALLSQDDDFAAAIEALDAS